MTPFFTVSLGARSLSILGMGLAGHWPFLLLTPVGSVGGELCFQPAALKLSGFPSHGSLGGSLDRGDGEMHSPYRPTSLLWWAVGGDRCTRGPVFTAQAVNGRARKVQGRGEG